MLKPTASQRAGAVALPWLDRSSASTSPQMSTHTSATTISDRLVENPFSTWGRLSLNASQFRKVWKNCCTCGRPLSGDGRDRGRVGAEVLLEELVREPLRLEAVEDVVDRGHVRRALVQHGAVLLAGLELADHRGVLDLARLDRSQHDRRVQQDRVDLAGVQGGEGVGGGVVDLGLRGRLDVVRDVGGAGGVGLRAPAELLGVGHAGHRGAPLRQDPLVGLEVWRGELDHLGPVVGDGDLAEIDVALALLAGDQPGEGHLHELDVGDVEALGDLLGQVDLVPAGDRVVVVADPERRGRQLRADRQRAAGDQVLEAARGLLAAGALVVVAAAATGREQRDRRHEDDQSPAKSRQSTHFPPPRILRVAETMHHNAPAVTFSGSPRNSAVQRWSARKAPRRRSGGRGPTTAKRSNPSAPSSSTWSAAIARLEYSSWAASEGGLQEVGHRPSSAVRSWAPAVRPRAPRSGPAAAPRCRWWPPRLGNSCWSRRRSMSPVMVLVTRLLPNGWTVKASP